MKYKTQYLQLNANYSMLYLLNTKTTFEKFNYGGLIIMVSKKEILIKFGEKVREIRKEKRLSQEELSFRANVHRTYIGMIERAEKNITLINIEKIAKALDVDIKQLF